MKKDEPLKKEDRQPAVPAARKEGDAPASADVGETRQDHSAAATGQPGDSLAGAPKAPDPAPPAPKGRVNLVNLQPQKLLLEVRDETGLARNIEIVGRGSIEWTGPASGELGPDVTVKARRGVLQVIPLT